MGIIILCCLSAIIILLIIFEIYRELHCFQTIHYDLQMNKEYTADNAFGSAKDEKIAFLSDLHLHEYGKDNSELLHAIEIEKPKYILIGGDLIVGKKELQADSLFSFLNKLAKIAPVYYANGNHEQRVKLFPEIYDLDFQAYRRKLEGFGIHFLENTSTILELQEKKVMLTGLEIPLHCYTHFKKIPLTIEEIQERIGVADSEYYQIMLAHNPQYSETYVDWGGDLILSGHLHGGIMRIPGVLGIISPAFHLFPKYSGDHYKIGTADIVVSKGLGTHTVNIRLFNPAELVILHFIS